MNLNAIAKRFRLQERGTNVKTEVLAGLTTFVTMAYILIVQPNAIMGGNATMVDADGVLLTKEAIMVSCALVSGIITILMGLYADMPFALSTGLGSNFMFGAMIQTGTCSLGRAMAITLISGIIFVILSLVGIRDLIVRMMPKCLKLAIGCSIGFFIAYIGFKNSGIGSYTNGISMGNFKDPAVLLAIFGLFLIATLTAFKVNGAILIGIFAVTLIGIPMGITPLPSQLVSVPSLENLGSLIFNFDFKGFFQPETFVLMFIVFVGDFFSTLGTVLGVGGKAGMLDENGDLPNIQKPFLVDAIGTVVGACTGNTTITTFVESSAGVEAGGRTGLTAVVTGLLYLCSFFVAPIFLMVPNAATGPALIFVGFLMVGGIVNVDFSDFTEAFGPFVMIMASAFMGSIAVGIAAGILSYLFIKVVTGKFKEIHPGMYVLAVPLIMYFIFN